jgi:hypothetical protein
MYLGKIAVDRYTADITEPVENRVFDAESLRIMKLALE